MNLYLIYKADIDEQGLVQPAIVIDHAFTISLALKRTERNARDLIAKTCGDQTATDCKIIDILKLEQVNEPLIDTVLIYKLSNDPHCLHVYRRQTKIVLGRLYGSSTIPEFKKVAIFYSSEYTKLKEVLEKKSFVPSPPPLKMIAVDEIEIVPSEVKGTVADMLKELVTSPKFLRKKMAISTTPVSLPHPGSPILEMLGRPILSDLSTENTIKPSNITNLSSNLLNDLSSDLYGDLPVHSPVDSWRELMRDELHISIGQFDDASEKAPVHNLSTVRDLPPVVEDEMPLLVGDYDDIGDEMEKVD